MNASDLTVMVRELAKPLGYRRKGHLSWKRGPQLTVILHLQSSRWGGGVYVNLGVIPNPMVLRPYPPGPGYWPLGERAESLAGPFMDVFEAASADRHVPEATMRGAFEWLLRWIETNLVDEERLRAGILGQVRHPVIGDARRTGEWMLADWAHGRLRAPAHYYRQFGGAYYRQSVVDLEAPGASDSLLTDR